MKILFIFIVAVICSITAMSQEELKPLKYNSDIIKNKQEKTGAIHESFIYSIDTLNLPIIDDFSRDKFKKYNAQKTDVNVSDTTWYRLYNSGIVEPMGTIYMTDTTFTYQYDTVAGFGFDSIVIISKTPFPSSFIDVYDIDNYEITIQNKEVWPAKNHYDSVWTGTSPDIILVEQTPDLEQDSSTVYFVATIPEDSAYIWVDNNVYRNNTFPINPISIGVATFDGLNSNGYPYDWSSPSAQGVADYLTSKPINLATKTSGGNYTAADSIYFSFAFQTTGLGEVPEPEDSLVLEFWSPTFATWNTVWRSPGVPQEDFEVVMVPIRESHYFNNGFKFRFKNYGTLTGSLDHWHIDYIILDDFRSINDYYMNDWAFQFPAPSLIKNYTSMPWKHYETDPYGLMKTDVSVETFNSLNQAKIIQPSNMELFYKNINVNTIPYVNSAGNVNALSNFDMDYTIPTTFFFDTILADTCATFNVKYTLSTNTTPERITENDTIIVNQKFENYYSYDDGTAEAAYGLVTNGAELAYKFTLPNNVEDTLRALKIHFVSSVNDVSNSLFFIQIWDDNNGQPGNVIYSTDDPNIPVTYTPHYNLGNNNFYEYELPQKILLSGTFYVGWKQSSSDRLNIGFDKNINNSSKIFYNLGTNWNNTSFSGSLMMRPVFTYEKDYITELPPSKYNIETKIYPNPTSSLLNIYTNKYIEGKIEIYDIYGRLIQNKNFAGNTTKLNVENILEGNYICIIKNNNGEIISNKKIIILR